jgi:hypothetical protein
MKQLAVLALIGIVASCGKYDVQGVSGSTVGEVKSLQTAAALSDADRTNLSDICSALSAKSATLSTVGSSVFTFSTSQMDCAKNETADSNVQTVIQGAGGIYSFKLKSSGLDFVFPNVETNTSGILSSICSGVSTSLSTLTSPLISGGEAIFFTTSGISSDNCQPGSGEKCVQIEKAIINGSSATVYSKDWLRIRTSTTLGKTGFFTYRKNVAQSYCAQGEAIITKATLK